MDYYGRAMQYCADVASEKIPACKWVKAACERHYKDLQRAGTAEFEYVFDKSKANRVCKFMEKLPHTKGKWARISRVDPSKHLIHLEDWQCFILCVLFGWVDSQGFRRFGKASLYIPRKNGKSIFGAGIGWYLFAYDNEPGAEVYSGATTEKQAWEVFRPAKQMAKIRPELSDTQGVTVNAGSMIIEGDGAKFEPVIGNPGDGASPHCAIIDEYHEHPTSAMVDTMVSGMGAREQPLLLIISTAGSLLNGPCREDWRHCESVLAGTVTDERLFAIIYTCDDGDDWTSEVALRKANPNFDVSVSGKFLREQLADAIRQPRNQNRFKTKHLNIWTNSASAYFNLQRWTKLENPTLDLANFDGEMCFASSDFAAKSDLATTVLLFPRPGGRWAYFGRYYLPRATVELPENAHYRQWEAQGRLTVTEGDITDLQFLTDDLVAFSKRFSVQEWLYDPNRVYAIVTSMQDAGINVVPVLTNAGKLSKPMKFLDDCIRAGLIEHDGDPVFSWCLSNVVGKENRKDEVYPTKESNAKKIDPVVALLSAFSRAIDAPPPQDFRLFSVSMPS